jgi:hypothetical protein
MTIFRGASTFNLSAEGGVVPLLAVAAKWLGGEQLRAHPKPTNATNAKRVHELVCVMCWQVAMVVVVVAAVNAEEEVVDMPTLEELHSRCDEARKFAAQAFASALATQSEGSTRVAVARLAAMEALSAVRVEEAAIAVERLAEHTAGEESSAVGDEKSEHCYHESTLARLAPGPPASVLRSSSHVAATCQRNCAVSMAGLSGGTSASVCKHARIFEATSVDTGKSKQTSGAALSWPRLTRAPSRRS